MRENILITLSSATPASSVFIIAPTALLAAGGAAVPVFVVAAFASLFVGLCYAELSATYPIAGGEYTWAARLLGKPAGFATVTLTMVSGVLALAVIALGTGQYLGVVWPSLGGKWIGVGIIVAATIVAALRIRANAWITGIALGIEIAAIAVLCVLGFAHAARGPEVFLHARTVHSGHLATVGTGALAALIPVALFSYTGFGTAVYYAEETKNAGKAIGRIVMICLAITVAVEVLPLAAVILGAPTMTGLLGSATPMNYLLTSRGDTVINDVVSLGIAIAIVNAVIASLLQLARLLFCSARDRSWPTAINRVLSWVHPRLRTPVTATALAGLLAVLSAAFMPMTWLIAATGSTIVVIYLVVALAALRLRRSGALSSRGYRMPWWPLPPLVVIAIIVYAAYQVLITAWTQLAVAIVTMIVGAVYYRVYLYPRRGERFSLLDPVHEDQLG